MARCAARFHVPLKTKVTWTYPFMNKVGGLFINLETMVGRAFEDGPQNLKA